MILFLQITEQHATLNIEGILRALVAGKKKDVFNRPSGKKYELVIYTCY